MKPHNPFVLGLGMTLLAYLVFLRRDVAGG